MRDPCPTDAPKNPIGKNEWAVLLPGSIGVKHVVDDHVGRTNRGNLEGFTGGYG